MKAKLGNEIVEYWQISLTKPANESWVLEAFKKGQLSWSGQFAMNKIRRPKKNYLLTECLEKIQLSIIPFLKK